MTKESEMVCILSRESPQAEHVDVLCYGDGKIRTYWEDRIDPRIGKTVRVRNVDDAIEVLAAGDGTKVMMPVWVARRIGRKDWVFDRP